MSCQPHNPEQINTLLREVQSRLSQGDTLAQVSMPSSTVSLLAWRSANANRCARMRLSRSSKPFCRLVIRPASSSGDAPPGDVGRWRRLPLALAQLLDAVRRRLAHLPRRFFAAFSAPRTASLSRSICTRTVPCLGTRAVTGFVVSALLAFALTPAFQPF